MMQCYNANNFDVSLNYYCNQSARAHILSMRRSHLMSGTQTMRLINYIVPRMGVPSATLVNEANLLYLYRDHQQRIPLIELRCMRGKHSDWYSDFGYFNANRESIAQVMQAIHCTEVHIDDFGGTVCLGPYLHSLWITDSTEFHEFYIRFQDAFDPLLRLRKGTWNRQFACNQSVIDQQPLRDM